MFDTLYLAILRDAVFFSSIIIFWLYWRSQVSEREDVITDLQTNIKDKNTNLSGSEKRIQKQETELESLNTKLNQTEETVSGLIEMIEEKDNSINLLKGQVADLKKQNQEIKIHAENVVARAKDLRKSTQEQAAQIQNLNTKLSQSEKAIHGLTAQIKEKDNSINLHKKTIADLEKKNQDTTIHAEDAEARARAQLSQREETIQGLNTQIKEKDDSINLLKRQVTDLEKQNQDTTIRAEDAEARIKELENSIEEKEKETTALIVRSRARQDNFAYIAGIGPKVSEILRSAGINTFAQLAKTEVNRVKEILEAENPSLLRLTDSTTWPEQARMAEEGDWEALSALQESLKGGRRA